MWVSWVTLLVLIERSGKKVCLIAFPTPAQVAGELCRWALGVLARSQQGTGREPQSFVPNQKAKGFVAGANCGAALRTLGHSTGARTLRRSRRMLTTEASAM